MKMTLKMKDIKLISDYAWHYNIIKPNIAHSYKYKTTINTNYFLKAHRLKRRNLKEHAKSKI